MNWCRCSFFSVSNGQFSPGCDPHTIVPGLTALSGYSGDRLFYQHHPSTIREPAIFGEVPYQATQSLKITAGARWYEIESRAGGTEQGGAVGGVVTDLPTTLTEVGVNSNVQADFQVNPDAMVYTRPRNVSVRAASCRRCPAAALGCPAQLASLGLTTQQTHEYQSDNLWNYELGSKTTWFDNRLTVNADVFYIDWKNIQQQILLSCGFQFRTNAGGTASPLQPGNRLYQVPDWTANTTVTCTVPLNARFALTFAADEIAFVGKNLTLDQADLADNRSIAVELPGRPRIVTNQPITFGVEFRSSFK